ncbi:MAG TPA: dienelactone hydrolase family protein [Cytophagales bacterium]|nr:dienelactone hydrolase family protein [Cytophagales bacterium]
MRKRITFLALVMVTPFMKLSGQGTEVKYQQGEATLKGYFVRSKRNSKKAPGVLVLSTWMGINEHSKGYAERLSSLGYHAFVADVYGEGYEPKDKQEAAKLSGFYKKDYKAYQDRIRIGLDQLVRLGADPQKIVVIGFCFGGTGALEAARGGLPVAGVVSIHGGLSKDSSRAHVSMHTKILVLHGADDPRVPPQDVAAFIREANEGKADWQLIAYSGAVHAFTDPSAGADPSKGSAYNETAARRSWEHLKIFLKELFEEK